jgi:hypothetical protein
MNDSKHYSRIWLNAAKALPVPFAVAVALPGLIAAINSGGLSASAARLLPHSHAA